MGEHAARQEVPKLLLHAAMEGLSLSSYLLQEVRRVAAVSAVHLRR